MLRDLLIDLLKGPLGRDIGVDGRHCLWANRPVEDRRELRSHKHGLLSTTTDFDADRELGGVVKEGLEEHPLKIAGRMMRIAALVEGEYYELAFCHITAWPTMISPPP